MSRLLAVAVVIAAIGVVVATQSSGAARGSAPPRASGAVVVTPRLKRLLQSEISTLRAAQPRARAPGTVPRAPDRGVPCYVAGRCSEIPCRWFASAGVVFKRSSTAIVVPGTPRRKVAAPACGRGRARAPHKLVLVSGP
ncbi:MAG TPA: hypothetical protein VG295_03120 [Solirubrobacteraceae bacterium]|jgi:hypothetical protein|nr:hypothetical protein [Solirubrobacteraceae bacterium]